MRVIGDTFKKVTEEEKNKFRYGFIMKLSGGGTIAGHTPGETRKEHRRRNLVF